ncbi:hypothetical protein A0H81_11763 [Grifola frondosa]|uniref:Uncharacterized protein n=1 Tax=Grifola frondosa TaxID=5627 RepID=A0A1C7LTY0_GRIFR|nr:hypothetical protein A0H81_11763 [Grifola frondosa]
MRHVEIIVDRTVSADKAPYHEMMSPVRYAGMRTSDRATATASVIVMALQPSGTAHACMGMRSGAGSDMHARSTQSHSGPEARSLLRTYARSAHARPTARREKLVIFMALRAQSETPSNVRA